MVVKIHVVYCGAWGYEPKFKALRDQLMDEFRPEDIDISGEATPGATGFFEVQIVGGALLHSKKNGDGYVNNQAKLDKIIKGIKDAL